jgi:hypothetical protein
MKEQIHRKKLPVRRCRVCGCTDGRACPSGCWWALPDVCSQCVGMSMLPRKRHVLKAEPRFFRAVWKGIKSFEIRRNDRDYQLYDELDMREWDKRRGFSGDQIIARVVYTTDFMQRPGYVVLGIRVLSLMTRSQRDAWLD